MDRAILNRGEDTEFECKGFKRNLTKTVITHILSILTFGIPYLIGHWKPEWKIKWFNTSCPLIQADKVVVTPIFGNDASSTHIVIKGNLCICASKLGFLIWYLQIICFSQIYFIWY